MQHSNRRTPPCDKRARPPPARRCAGPHAAGPMPSRDGRPWGRLTSPSHGDSVTSQAGREVGTSPQRGRAAPRGLWLGTSCVHATGPRGNSLGTDSSRATLKRPVDTQPAPEQGKPVSLGEHAPEELACFLAWRLPERRCMRRFIQKCRNDGGPEVALKDTAPGIRALEITQSHSLIYIIKGNLGPESSR